MKAGRAVTASCRGCGIELTRVLDISFAQCLTCNHEEVEEQLVTELRRMRRNALTEKQRLLCAAWAAYVKGDTAKATEIKARGGGSMSTYHTGREVPR